MTYGDLIKKLRTEAGMTQKEFAEFIHTPVRTLQHWEINERKVPENVMRLMAYKLEMEKIAKDVNAQIDECVDFWSKREQWESPFKMALGSDSEASFETQWKTAVDNLNKIADIDGMCKKMTEKARAQAQELGLE